MSKIRRSRLELLARKWMPSHYRVIESAMPEILISNQCSFLNSFQDRKKVDHFTVGNYYELLTWGLYGGEIFSKSPLCRLNNHNTGISFLEDFDYFFNAKPDLINFQTKEIREAKSLSPGRACKFDDVQLMNYQNLQFRGRDYKVSFVLYRYGLTDIDSYKEGLDDLFRDLGEKTFFSVDLPLSVIIALHNLPFDKQFENLKEIAYRENNCLSGSRTLVKSRFINYFFEHPKQAIEKVGLSASDYTIERLRTPFDFYFVFSDSGERKRFIVRPFPILVVRDKNHLDWVSRFAYDFETSINENFPLFANKNAPREDSVRGIDESSEENAPF